MMSKVAIVTDSIACLTKEQAEHYGIRIVPANILFEGKVYRERAHPVSVSLRGVLHYRGDPGGGDSYRPRTINGRLF